MAKLLINNQNKVLVGSNGKAYAVNLDAASAQQYPLEFNAAAGSIMKLSRYGKCEQASTPTPSAPVNIVCNNGAIKFSPNMANVNAQTARVGYYISSQGTVMADVYNWFYQDFIPCKPNTIYTLSMSQSVYYVSISEYSTAADSGFVVRKTGSTGSNTSLTITTGANTNFLRFGTNVDRTSVTLEEVLSINWMLVPGSSAVPYIPYVEGGIYIDGTPEVMTVIGQNLVDLTAVTDGYYYDPSGVYTSIEVARLTDYIPVRAGQKYTVYVKAQRVGTAANVRCNLFDSAQAWKSQSSFVVASGSEAVSVITPTENGYLRVSANYTGTGAKVDWSTLQIVLGEYTLSTMPPYKPYVTPQIASVENILSVGDYKDEQDIISGLLTHKIGIKVFDGTEAWRASSSANIYILDSAIAVNLTAICTHFLKVSNTTSAANMTDGSFKGHSSNAILYFKYEAAGNVDGFKSWLTSQYAAGTPVIMLYPLATSTVDEVTPQPLNTSSGQNTITDVAEVSNPELYIIHKI